MENRNSQLKPIQLLIERIQNHYTIDDLKLNKYHFDKLLVLSERVAYSYGLTIAYICLAYYYSKIFNQEEFNFNLDKAKEIAQYEDYHDILLQCYRLEGESLSNQNDDHGALSCYLKGLNIAIELNDEQSAAVYYAHIGGLFKKNAAYEDAKVFYQKARRLYEKMPQKTSVFYYKMILLSLAQLSCEMNEIDQAIDYLKQVQAIQFDVAYYAFMIDICEIALLDKQNKYSESVEQLSFLIEKMKNTNTDKRLLIDPYMQIMELCLHLKQKDYATFCKQQIEATFRKTNPSIELKIKELQVRYTDVFGIQDHKCFVAYYTASRLREKEVQIAMGNGFKSMIDLYEANQERNRLAKKNSDLQTVINTDGLTGVYNRRYLTKIMTKMIQDKQVTSIAFMMCDVDHLKDYNDNYGHATGDQLLFETAKLLTSNLPDEESKVIRYGGDEFCCLFVNRTLDVIVETVKRIQADIQNRSNKLNQWNKLKLVPLSFGIYYETDLQNCDEYDMIQKADSALYEAKRRGRNNYVVYTKKEEQ